MKRPFAARQSGVEVRLAVHERQLLVFLLGQLDTLLDDGATASDDPLAALVGMADLGGGPVAAPEDPALARLLPDASRDDPEAAAEFRRLTEHGLRSRKRSSARRCAELLEGEGRLVLDDESATMLLKSLNDLRLVLGERLELRDDADTEQLHERLRRDPQVEPELLALGSVYEQLTWWLEELLFSVAGRR